MRFLYVLDPMCAWCYGFQPELEAFLAQYPEAQVGWIMGGLAPDSDQPMAESMRHAIASYWRQIEQSTQVSFNHDYWVQNTPYRSTYIACRAVIATESICENSSASMVKAIQNAYYQKALNPSLESTLIDCAGTLGLDKEQFKDVLNSAETETQLQYHFSIARQLNVSGFPALFYVNDAQKAHPLALGFSTASKLSKRMAMLISS